MKQVLVHNLGTQKLKQSICFIKKYVCNYIKDVREMHNINWTLVKKITNLAFESDSDNLIIRQLLGNANRTCYKWNLIYYKISIFINGKPHFNYRVIMVALKIISHIYRNRKL